MKIEQISADSILGVFALIAGICYGLSKLISAFDLFSKQREKITKKKMEPYLKEIDRSNRAIFDEIKAFDDKTQENFKILENTEKNLAKLEILDIYESYKKEKRVPAQIKASILDTCQEYFSHGGNSYISEIVYPEIKSWETY